MDIEHKGGRPEIIAKEAERAFLDNPGPLSKLFEFSPTAILVHFQGIIRFANPAAGRMLGDGTPESIVGKPVLDFVHPGFREQVVRRMQESVATGQHAATAQETLLRLDGNSFVAEVSAFPVPFESGTAIVALARDVSGQVEADLALRRSEERFRRLVDEVQVGVLVTDAETQIILANPAAHDLLGLDYDEILARTCFDPLWDVVDEQNQAMQQANFPIPTAVRLRKSVRGVVMGVARPGLQERIWLLVDAHPIFDSRGEVERVVCTFSDITGRRLSELALRESEARFRMVVQGLGEGLLISDLTGMVLFANDRFFQMSGFEAGDIEGKNVTEIVPIQSCCQVGGDSAGDRLAECNLVRKDLGRIWIQLRSTPFKSVGGEVIGTLWAMTDITDRKRVEEEAEQSKDRLQLALETSNDGLWDWLIPEGQIYLNPAAGRIFGRGPNEWVTTRKELEKLIHPDDFAEADRQMNLHLSGNSSRLEVQLRIRTPDGNYRWVRSNGKVIARNADGEATRFIGTLSDIDSILRTQEELREARDLLEHRVAVRTEELTKANEALREEIVVRRRAEEQLKASNAELEAFAHTISHDLKAPLRAISGFAAALIEDCGDSVGPEGLAHIEVITDSVERMEAMFDDLLSLARLGRQDASKTEVDLAEVMKICLSNLSVQIAESNAIVKVQADLPKIRGFRTALVQLFQNLIANGIKFVAPGKQPVVEIVAADEGDAWLFTVADNGIGIRPESVERIFEPFERLFQRDEYPGTGIGLAIAKKATQLHGGTIWVEPVPKGGSRFSIRIPKAGKTGG